MKKFQKFLSILLLLCISSLIGLKFIQYVLDLLLDVFGDDSEEEE